MRVHFSCQRPHLFSYITYPSILCLRGVQAPFGLEESHRNFGGSNSGGKETRDAVWNKGSFPTVPEERKLLAHKTQERENPLRSKGTKGTLRSLSRLSRHGLSSSRHCLSPSRHGLIPSHTRACGRARRPPPRIDDESATSKCIWGTKTNSTPSVCSTRTRSWRSLIWRGWRALTRKR